ncbi:MAG TPA: hypothetical protein VFW37_09990 [Alphaproteobacteria bacterium]|nr:hypothetical protein [Alphaproteobacteria bacterium]
MARDGRVFYGLTCKGAFRDTSNGQTDRRIETARGRLTALQDRHEGET